MKGSKSAHRGFTLVELLIAVVIIGILAGLVMNYIPNARERGQLSRTETELHLIADAAKLYAESHGDYPAEVDRDLPEAIKDQLASQDIDNPLPNTPLPGTVYDYDAWDIDGDGRNETIQISVRFCPSGGPLDACKFPDQPWSENMTIDSAYYYCVKGFCRASNTDPRTPGYCVNCSSPDQPKLMPGETL